MSSLAPRIDLISLMKKRKKARMGTIDLDEGESFAESPYVKYDQQSPINTGSPTVIIIPIEERNESYEYQ